MTNRDRTAVDIELLHWDAEAIATVNDLHGECFVEFPQVDIVNGQTIAFE